MIDDRIDAVRAWLQREDGRLGDIFGLWTQGKRDDGWVADRLVTEGHLAALIEDTATPAPPDEQGWQPDVVLPEGTFPPRDRRTRHATPAPLDELREAALQLVDEAEEMLERPGEMAVLEETVALLRAAIADTAP